MKPIVIIGSFVLIGVAVFYLNRPKTQIVDGAVPKKQDDDSFETFWALIKDSPISSYADKISSSDDLKTRKKQAVMDFFNKFSQEDKIKINQILKKKFEDRTQEEKVFSGKLNPLQFIVMKIN